MLQVDSIMLTGITFPITGATETFEIVSILYALLSISALMRRNPDSREKLSGETERDVLRRNYRNW